MESAWNRAGVAPAREGQFFHNGRCDQSGQAQPSAQLSDISESRAVVGWAHPTLARTECPGTLIGPASGASLPRQVPRKRKEPQMEESPPGAENWQPNSLPLQAPASVSSSAAPACTADLSSCATGANAASMLTMQLTPADPQAEAHVSGLGFNPLLELSRVRRTKSVKSLLIHLSSKWACPAGKALVLLPPSEPGRGGVDPAAYWGATEHGTTLVEAIYESVGRPHLFKLRYAFIDYLPAEPRILNQRHTPAQQQQPQQWQPPTLNQGHTPTQQQQQQPQEWQPPTAEQHDAPLPPPLLPPLPAGQQGAEARAAMPAPGAPGVNAAAGERGGGAAPRVGAGATRGAGGAAVGAQQLPAPPPKVTPAFETTPASGNPWLPAWEPVQQMGAPWQPQVQPRRWRTAMPPPMQGGPTAGPQTPAGPCSAPGAEGRGTGSWEGAAAGYEPHMDAAQGQPAAQPLLPSNGQQQPAAGSAGWPWMGASSAAAAPGAPPATRPQHLHQMLPSTDDCSLGFLLQSLDDTPALPSTTAQQAPPATEDSLLRGLLGGECSLDAFAGGFAAGPVAGAAPAGPVSFSHLEASMSWAQAGPQAATDAAPGAGAAAGSAGQRFPFGAQHGPQEGGQLRAKGGGGDAPCSAWGAAPPSTWVPTAPEASGKQQPPPRSKKQRQQPTKAADAAGQNASGRARPRAKPAKPAARRPPAASQKAPARPRGKASAPKRVAPRAEQSAAAAATFNAAALAGRATAAPLPAPPAAAAQQDAFGGASGTPVEESSLDGLFTASMFDALPAPSDADLPASCEPPTLLASLGDFSDSFLPPSLAHLSLPPLDAATAAHHQAGQGAATAAAASGKATGHGMHPAGALPLPPQPGEAGHVYGAEAELEIGLGSLLGAGGDSWLGLAAHRTSSASCSQTARKPFHMLFPTTS